LGDEVKWSETYALLIPLNADLLGEGGRHRTPETKDNIISMDNLADISEPKLPPYEQ